MLTKTTVLVMVLTANVLSADFCDDEVDKGVFGLCKLWTKNAALLDRLRELLGMSAAGDLRVLLTGPTMSCSKLFLENEDMRADCEKSYSDQQFAPFMIQKGDGGDQSYLVALARKDLPSLSSIKAFEGEISQEAKQVEPDQFIVFKDRVYPFACTLKSENCLLSQVLFEIQQLKDSSSSQIQKLKDANSVFRDLNRVFKTEFISVNPDF